ncbi:hypothetical protein GWK08_01375 [Leptobacterium flavescens]|uniref:TraB/GumN family protein n=1 Tax=Leptobacterium flavescens TaxID=472055 RepID=A0A6P0UJN1_9FLAO|nr:DUF5694 domain-containing protein [Leptobacterium flavescens]NER12079.1 hypothetical protein [Leptobacterium flavescens]
MFIKRFFGFLLLFVVFLSCSDTGKNQDVKQVDGPSIAILGTFHFASTSDYSSMDLDNFNSDKRQKEIRQLVNLLKAYKPTKIMVEYPYRKRDKLNADYQNYLEGNYDLSINEIDQLGFRLTKELGHSEIYCVDMRMSLPFGPLSDYAEKYEKENFEAFLKGIKDSDKEDSERLKRSTLTSYFAYKNTDKEDILNKNRYLDETAQFVSDSIYIGVEFVSKWWERNFHIMANIDLQTEKDDRILLIIGGAHRAVLKDFYEDRLDVNYIEIADYLN